jgi:YHS domain-containing protein
MDELSTRNTVMTHDPVCGMPIAEHDAYAVRHIGGAPVYFCSAACVERFDAAPQPYYPPLGSTSAEQIATMARPARRLQAQTPVVGGQPLLRPLAFGLLAVLGLLVFYLGIITLAQGWGHAIQQLADDGWFIGVIASGTGTTRPACRYGCPPPHLPQSDSQ